MKDGFGREIEYLRISVTQNCNLNCIYCSPGQGAALPHCPAWRQAALSPQELERIVRPMVKAGIRKIRITGGEPLVREDVTEIIARIAKIPGVADLSMTTNGIHLDRMAPDLKANGLQRLNISLDSLCEERFERITGGGRLTDTLRGIEKALAVGFHPVKTNTVLMKGVNDDEIDAFIQLAKDRPLEVRFIELMPIGRFGEQNSDKVVPHAEIIQARPGLVLAEDNLTGQPAVYYKMAGYQGKIGFISPVSHKFCNCCNRIRLTCDGKIKPCLGNNGEVDIAAVLRHNPRKLDAAIQKAIFEKPAGHHFGSDFSSTRNMKTIGG